MADGLFGVPVGLRAYQDDQIKLGQLANQTKQANSATALADAQTANFAADNARADRELQEKLANAKDAKLLQQELARIAAGEPAGEGGPSAASVLAGGSKFDSLLAVGQKQASYLLATGRIAEAVKLLPSLTNGTKDLAQARQAVSAAKENEWDAATKKHEFTSRHLSGVTDQASYQQARMAMVASGLYTKEDLAEMPPAFNSRFVKGAIAGSAAAKQKADLEREALRSATLNASTNDEIKNRKLVRELEERKFTLTKEREDRLEKQGEARLGLLSNKPKGAPTPREVTAISAELKRLGLKIDSSMSASLKNDVVEEVRDRVRSSSLSWGEAAAAVVAEMKADGRIEVPVIGSDNYKPDGKTVGRALPLPSSRDGLVANMYYTINGETRLFDGSAWKPVEKKGGTK